MALANFALTFAKALLVFCVVLFVLISPDTTQTSGVKTKAEYIITIEWPMKHGADIDTWIRNPDGRIVYYRNKEAGFTSIERDELGSGCVVSCEEVAVIRAITPGEYVVNAHLYSFDSSSQRRKVEELPVQIKVEKINPDLKLLWKGELVFTQVRQELHGVRFTIKDDGEVTDINSTHPILLRETTMQEYGGDKGHDK